MRSQCGGPDKARKEPVPPKSPAGKSSADKAPVSTECGRAGRNRCRAETRSPANGRATEATGTDSADMHGHPGTVKAASTAEPASVQASSMKAAASMHAGSKEAASAANSTTARERQNTRKQAH